MAAKKTKGKRYSDSEKQEVLDFVAKVDSDKGRGGVAAAVRKYGITPLTISAWKKKSQGGSARSGKASAGGSSVKRGATPQSRNLHRLAEIVDELATVDARKAELEKEYAQLKKAL